MSGDALDFVRRTMLWVRERLTLLIQSDEFYVPFSVFIASRVFIYGLLTVLVGLLPNVTPGKANFWFLMRRWDGDWYFRAAEEGYIWLGADKQTTAGFYPLYPLLGRLMGFLFADTHWGLLVVVNVAFAFCLYFMYRWGKVSTDRATAERAIVYLAMFPAAFVTASFYAESLLFALCAGTFWFVERKEYRAAITLGAFATATRVTGLAIILPVAYTLWRERRWRMLALAVLVIPLGSLFFYAYLWALSGDPLAYFTIQRQSWFQVFTYPWDTVHFALERMTWAAASYTTALAWLDGGSILLFIALTIGAWRMRPTAEFLFAVSLLLLTLWHTVDATKGPPTQAAARHLMALLPCFIVLARLGRNRYLDMAIRWLFIALQAIFAAYFFSGVWVV